MKQKHHLITRVNGRFSTLSGCSVAQALRYCTARRENVVASFKTDKECQAAFSKSCVASNQYPEELYYGPSTL